MAEVDASNDEMSRQEKAVRCRIQREREDKLQSALNALNILETGKQHAVSKAPQVSLSDPDAGFMRHGDGAIAPSYNVQLTTDATRGLVVGVAVSKASNDAQQMAAAMDRFRQQYGSFPAQVVADGDFTNHESVIAMHERGIEFFGSFGERRLRRPKPRCPSRQACCGHSELRQTGRKITVSEDQVPVCRFDERMRTERGKKIYRQRARVAEFPHAWIKSKCGLRQFRCRTISKVTCEVLFATLTYNFQRYLKLSTP